MGMTFDDFMHLEEDKAYLPKMKDYFQTVGKHDYYYPSPKFGTPYYYSVVKDSADGEPYIESVKYETIQFRLRWSDYAYSDTRNYTLEWLPNDGQKYAFNIGISLTAMAYGPLSDPNELAHFLAKNYQQGMEDAGRSPAEIKCMYDFLGKLAWAEMNSSGESISSTYNYNNAAPKYAKGGIVMSSKGIKGPGFEIGAGKFDVDEYGNVNGSGGGWIQEVSYDEHYGLDNYRQPEVDILPGVKEVVKHPVTGDKSTIENIIINLNDVHMWTRHQIADWLETLDVDLTFKDEPAKVEKKRKHNEALGYHKGQKIEYKGSGKLGKQKMADVYKGEHQNNTISMDINIDAIDPKALEMLFGGKLPPPISKEELLKQIGGDTA